MRDGKWATLVWLCPRSPPLTVHGATMPLPLRASLFVTLFRLSCILVCFLTHIIIIPFVFWTGAQKTRAARSESPSIWHSFLSPHLCRTSHQPHHPCSTPSFVLSCTWYTRLASSNSNRSEKAYAFCFSCSFWRYFLSFWLLLHCRKVLNLI